MTAPLLVADRLTFGYNSTSPIIQEWSAEFHPGEIVAVTGPSGRGKSTLLYILGLMLKPQSGRVVVDGAEVHGLGDRRRADLRAHRFGFVFQDAALDPSRTVIDNVIEAGLYRGDSRARLIPHALQLMEQFGVLLRQNARPGEVSGGQAQRIALCRALLNSPDILLADEPTGNLDSASAGVVMSALRTHVASGAVAIIVTHDPALVAQCDRSIQL